MIQSARTIALSELAQFLAKELEPTLERMTRCCLNCDHWRDEKSAVNPNTCNLYKALPPPRIIAYGCPSFLEIIPF